MRSEKEMTKINVKDLADQPAASQVLLVRRVERQLSSIGPVEVTKTDAFQIDAVVEMDGGFGCMVGYVGNRPVLKFSSDHQYLLVDREYLDLMTYSDYRQALLDDQVAMKREADRMRQTYEARLEGKEEPKKDFDGQAWLDGLDLGGAE